MNMSWKKTETPLNLIQILPSDRDNTEAKESSECSSNLRLQVGDNPPTVGSRFFSKVMNVVRLAVQRLGEMCKSCMSAIQQFCKRTIDRVVGIVNLVKRSMIWSVNFVSRCRAQLRWYFQKCWNGLIRKKNVRVDAQLQTISPAIETNVIATSHQLQQDELLWEVHALRDQLSSQKDELTRVNQQIAELKALSLSQQQVLLHLGKDLESIDSKHGKTEKVPAKKPKSRSTKTAKSKPLPSSRPSSTETTMSLNPRR